MKKYELVKEDSVKVSDSTLYRIRACMEFEDNTGKIIHVGDLGGYVESEENLSHKGRAWVSGDAQVFGDARVFGDAQVFGDAWVSGNALVFGDARVFGNARVSGNAWVSGNARVVGGRIS